MKTVLRRALLIVPLCLFGLVFFYALAALVLGLIPVNGDFRQSKDGIDIYLHANAVHTDLIVPMQSALRDWRGKLPGLPQAAQAEYLAVGWGDRAFYLETKTWADLKAGNALRAVTGQDGTLLHIEAVAARPAESAQTIRLRISAEQYARLVDSIDGSFVLGPDGKPVAVPGAHYGTRDAFYEAAGRYSLFCTCNDWVRATLARAGIRTASWAPFSNALTYQAKLAI